MDPIIVRGAGDIATGSIYRLVRAGYPVIALEIDKPSAIRRKVAFCQAVYDGEMQVEDMVCRRCGSFSEAAAVAEKGEVALLIDPKASVLEEYHPWLLVDAILAKKNLGTTIDMADVTVALGPGFTAGVDVDFVVETMRGHKLGRIYKEGTAIPNTGTPGLIGGHAADRVMHAPAAGPFTIVHDIGATVKQGETIGIIRAEEGDVPVPASISGILRGIINDGFIVTKGLKIADIDPRRIELENCFTISDKARAIGGSVLEIACAAEHARRNS